MENNLHPVAFCLRNFQVPLGMHALCCAVFYFCADFFCCRWCTLSKTNTRSFCSTPSSHIITLPNITSGALATQVQNVHAFVHAQFRTHIVVGVFSVGCGLVARQILQQMFIH